MPDFIMISLGAAMGAIWGSFVNVVISRLPSGKSVVLPGSSCESCGKKISFYNNIPILSCLILRAKCPSCGSSFGWRHMWVEVISACFFSATLYRFGFSIIALEYLIFGLGLIIVSFIDLDIRIIPDKISLPGICIGLLGAFVNPERDFLDAFLGVLCGGGFLLLIAYVYYFVRKAEGMGGGDIKLLAWIGAVLGLKSILFVVFVSSILGSLVGIFVSFSSKKGLKASLAFGPYLAMAAILYIFFGPDLISYYIENFAPWLQTSM